MLVSSIAKERVQLHDEDQNQKQNSRNYRKENKIITVDGHPVHSNALNCQRALFDLQDSPKLR